MNLNFFRNFKNNSQENKEVDDFINELSDSLENETDKAKMENIEQLQEEVIDNLIEDDCLYYVVEENIDFVYIQNMNTDEISKETDFPEEIKQNIMEGQILRCKNGTYYIDEEETEKYENSLVDVRDYTKIKQEFMETSGILDNDVNTRYNVVLHNKEDGFTILSYENNGIKEITVPNALLPYVVNNKKIFYYENGKFKTDVELTKINMNNN